MKTVALVAFITVYALLLLLPRGRWIAPVAAAALFVGVGIVPAGAAWEAVDWNVLMMLRGTMGTVDLFIRSKMPERLSDHLVNAIPSVKKLIIVLALFAGLVSAFVDNVATVLMLAPVGIAIAVSSNLQGAATLVGDTTSLLLAGHLKMDFLDFFVYQGKPGMFWFVQIGALATVPVMMWLFRKDEGYVAPAQPTVVEDYLPTWMMGGTVAALIAASFIPGRPALTNGFQGFYRGMGKMTTTLIGTCLQAGLRALGAALLAPRIGLPGIAYACAFGWCVMLCFEIPSYFYTCKKQQS